MIVVVVEEAVEVVAVVVMVLFATNALSIVVTAL